MLLNAPFLTLSFIENCHLKMSFENYILIPSGVSSCICHAFPCEEFHKQSTSLCIVIFGLEYSQYSFPNEKYSANQMLRIPCNLTFRENTG